MKCISLVVCLVPLSKLSVYHFDHFFCIALILVIGQQHPIQYQT
uniref:Uncharacterized protein n=1 Tax=Anguilla anguilla TaxID=7936 RepID=A0A0E9WSJ6_ANGAN